MWCCTLTLFVLTDTPVTANTKSLGANMVFFPPCIHLLEHNKENIAIQCRLSVKDLFWKGKGNTFTLMMWYQRVYHIVIFLCRSLYRSYNTRVMDNFLFCVLWGFLSWIWLSLWERHCLNWHRWIQLFQWVSFLPEFFMGDRPFRVALNIVAGGNQWLHRISRQPLSFSALSFLEQRFSSLHFDIPWERVASQSPDHWYFGFSSENVKRNFVFLAIFGFFSKIFVLLQRLLPGIIFLFFLWSILHDRVIGQAGDLNWARSGRDSRFWITLKGLTNLQTNSPILPKSLCSDIPPNPE